MPRGWRWSRSVRAPAGSAAAPPESAAVARTQLCGLRGQRPGVVRRARGAGRVRARRPAGRRARSCGVCGLRQAPPRERRLRRCARRAAWARGECTRNMTMSRVPAQLRALRPARRPARRWWRGGHRLRAASNETCFDDDARRQWARGGACERRAPERRGAAARTRANCAGRLRGARRLAATTSRATASSGASAAMHASSRADGAGVRSPADTALGAALRTRRRRRADTRRAGADRGHGARLRRLGTMASASGRRRRCSVFVPNLAACAAMRPRRANGQRPWWPPRTSGAPTSSAPRSAPRAPPSAPSPCSAGCAPRAAASAETRRPTLTLALRRRRPSPPTAAARRTATARWSVQSCRRRMTRRRRARRRQARTRGRQRRRRRQRVR